MGRKKVDYKQLGPYETHQLLHTRPGESAFVTFTLSQKLFMLSLLILIVLYIIGQGFDSDALIGRGLIVILIVNLLFTVFYVLHSFYKLLLINLSVIRTN